MASPKLELITYSQFNKLSFQLYCQIKESGFQPDLIIAINRGGAVLARILSDFFDVKIGAFAISSYAGINEQKELVISQALNLVIKNKKILVVDEVCDTGETFKVALKHVEKLEPAQVKTCAIFVKPHSVFQPDFVAEETDKWLVFPYEVKETINALGEIDQETQDKLNQYFKGLGYSEEQIGLLSQTI
jgi:uncharacterized protein